MKATAPSIYDVDRRGIDFRKQPELYLVGRGEQGVLTVEPYKSEILPFWRFKTPAVAKESADSILKIYDQYRADEDFVGMDMARKFLQMGFTRARRYANHHSGRKYSPDKTMLPISPDEIKAASAEVFAGAWALVEADELYTDMRTLWRLAFG